MFDDVGLDITRHALSEHHEMDELVEQLEQTDMSSLVSNCQTVE